MNVKELKKALEGLDDYSDIAIRIYTHEHLYNSCNEEIGRVDISTILPLNSVTIKKYGVCELVELSNLDEWEGENK